MADIQTVITGNVQQAQNILNNLLGQTWQYASSLQGDNLQFFNQAQNVLNNFPNIVEQLYNQTIYGIPANLPNLSTNTTLGTIGEIIGGLFPGINPIGTTLPNGLSDLEALDTGNPSLQPHTGGLTIRPVLPVPVSETSGVAQPNSIEGNFANTESSVSGLYNSLYNTINQNFASLRPYINSNFANAENSVNNIYNSLYNQATYNFDNLQQGIRTNFGNAINSVSNLYNSLYNTVEQNYNSLYQNIEQQMQDQWAKSSDVLSALGMYNSPATQQTQADITTQLYGDVAEQETQALNTVAGQQTQALSGLNISEANALNQALAQQTNVLNSIAGQQARLLSGLSIADTDTLNQLANEQINALNQVAGQQTQALTGLNISNMNTLDQLAQSELSNLTNYYQNLPTQEQKFAGWNVQMDPTLTNFGLQMQIAQALNGLNVGVLPQQSELSQFAQEAPGIIGALGGLMQLGAGLFGLATGTPLPMFMGFTGGISPWLSMGENALGSLWSGIESVGGDILSGIGDIASDIGSGIGDVVSDIGDAISSLF